LKDGEIYELEVPSFPEIKEGRQQVTFGGRGTIASIQMGTATHCGGGAGYHCMKGKGVEKIMPDDRNLGSMSDLWKDSKDEE